MSTNYTYTENNITFSKVQDSVVVIGGYPFATNSNKYETVSGSPVIQSDWVKSFNIIDVDWNGATIRGVSGTIDTTSDVLKIIGDLYARVSGLENPPN